MAVVFYPKIANAHHGSQINKILHCAGSPYILSSLGIHRPGTMFAMPDQALQISSQGGSCNDKM